MGIDYTFLRLLAKSYLSKVVAQLNKNNLPSVDWARAFVKCWFADAARAQVSKSCLTVQFSQYFSNLEEVLTNLNDSVNSLYTVI